MNFTEGFGKKWIERILGKVDKDQGVANAGKILGIGADGQVVPVEQSGGGNANVETISNMAPTELRAKLNVGDQLVVDIGYYYAATFVTTNLSVSEVNGVKTIVGTTSLNQTPASNNFSLMVIRKDDSNVYFDTISKPTIIDYTGYKLGNYTVNEYFISTAEMYYMNESGIPVTCKMYGIMSGENTIPLCYATSRTKYTTSFTGYIIHNS